MMGTSILLTHLIALCLKVNSVKSSIQGLIDIGKYPSMLKVYMTVITLNNSTMESICLGS